uniref:SH3 domain-containing protein n=1 Tax=Rhabditophanes sp. KR3021 TaxID=114890 RepID=A0AC35TM96_9BILA
MNQDGFMESSSPETTHTSDFAAEYHKTLANSNSFGAGLSGSQKNKRNVNFTDLQTTLPLYQSIVQNQSEEENQQTLYSAQIGAEIMGEAVAIEYIQRMKTWCPPQCFEVFFGDVMDLPIEFMKINQLILAQGGSCYGGNIFKVQKYLLAIPPLLVKKGFLAPAALTNSCIWDNWLKDLAFQLNPPEWQAFWYIYTHVFGLRSLPIQLISFFNVFAQNQRFEKVPIEQVIMNASMNPAFQSYTDEYLKTTKVDEGDVVEIGQSSSSFFLGATDNSSSSRHINFSVSMVYIEKRMF